jgi:hypothetical protein
MSVPYLGTLYGPAPYWLGTGASTAHTFPINGAGDEAYTTFVALQSDTVTDYDFAVTSNIGSTDVDVMISEIDANGRPTGVPAGGGAAESLTISSNGRKTGAFATPSTLVAGTQYAFLVQWTGNTGSFAIRTGDGITSGDANRWGDFVGTNNAGSYGESLSSTIRMGAYYSDGRAVLALTQTFGLASFRDSDSPDEYAVKFTVPVSMTINGIFAAVGGLSASATWDIVLYDTDGTTELGSGSFTQQQVGGRDWSIVMLSSDVTLTPGGSYRVSVRPSASLFVTIWRVSYDDLAQRSGWLNVAAEDFEGSTRTNLGAWTDSLTAMVVAGVVVKSLNISTPGSCSAVGVSYASWTRTGPVNTPWRLNFLAADGDNPVTNFEVWTGASRTGTQVASGAATSSSNNSVEIEYDAPGLADGTNSLFLSVDDGLGSVGADCAFTLLRDDVNPTAATGVTVGDP